jgi:hypothetical protein
MRGRPPIGDRVMTAEIFGGVADNGGPLVTSATVQKTVRHVSEGRQQRRPHTQKDTYRMSTNEVTKSTSNGRDLVDGGLSPDALAHLERYAREEQATRWCGRLLKFVKGDFIALDGDEEEDIELGTKLTVAVDTAMVGWERWIDQRIVDQRMGLVIEGYQRLERHELGDPNETVVDKKTGQARDPWQPVTRIILYGKKGDEDSVFTFVTRSYGGITAVAKMVGKAHKEMRMRPASYPIVELGADDYKNKKHNTTVDVPTFKIVGWDDDPWYGATIREEA